MAASNDKNKTKDVLTELKRGVEEVLIEEELLERLALNRPLLGICVRTLRNGPLTSHFWSAARCRVERFEAAFARDTAYRSEARLPSV